MLFNHCVSNIRLHYFDTNQPFTIVYEKNIVSISWQAFSKNLQADRNFAIYVYFIFFMMNTSECCSFWIRVYWSP